MSRSPRSIQIGAREGLEHQRVPDQTNAQQLARERVALAREDPRPAAKPGVAGPARDRHQQPMQLILELDDRQTQALGGPGRGRVRRLGHGREHRPKSGEPEQLGPTVEQGLASPGAKRGQIAPRRAPGRLALIEVARRPSRDRVDDTRGPVDAGQLGREVGDRRDPFMLGSPSGLRRDPLGDRSGLARDPVLGERRHEIVLVDRPRGQGLDVKLARHRQAGAGGLGQDQRHIGERALAQPHERVDRDEALQRPQRGQLGDGEGQLRGHQRRRWTGRGDRVVIDGDGLRLIDVFHRVELEDGVNSCASRSSAWRPCLNST